MWAVLWTDLVQFVIKMTAVIVLAVYAVRRGRRHGRAEGGRRDAFRQRDAALSVLPVRLTAGGIAGVRVDAAARARRLPLACSGGRRGIRAPSRAAAATSRSASSRRRRSATACSRRCSSRSRTTRSAVAVDHHRPRDGDPLSERLDRTRTRSGYVQAFVDLLPTPWRGFMMAGFAAAYMSTVGRSSTGARRTS